ncbi:hypothetical protein C8Q74DRAFT_440506 [Fomes fomentarius]|nr:hypothetical protein C8Q74DRAFT_440506 [Fomes fomentarius]
MADGVWRWGPCSAYGGYPKCISGTERMKLVISEPRSLGKKETPVSCHLQPSPIPANTSSSLAFAHAHCPTAWGTRPPLNARAPPGSPASAKPSSPGLLLARERRPRTDERSNLVQLLRARFCLFGQNQGRRRRRYDAREGIARRRIIFTAQSWRAPAKIAQRFESEGKEMDYVRVTHSFSTSLRPGGQISGAEIISGPSHSGTCRPLTSSATLRVSPSIVAWLS